MSSRLSRVRAVSLAVVSTLIVASFVVAGPVPSVNLYWLENFNPTTGAGVNAPLNQLLIRTDQPSIWYKSGAANTAWTELGSPGGSGGTVTSVACGVGILCSPSPIIGAGSVTLNITPTTCPAGQAEISTAANGTSTCAAFGASTISGLTANQTIKAGSATTIINAWATDDGTTWGASGRFTITEATGAFVASSTASIGGALNMNSHLINNVTDPVSAQDAVTLHYLQSSSGIGVASNVIPKGTGTGLQASALTESAGALTIPEPMINHVANSSQVNLDAVNTGTAFTINWTALGGRASGTADTTGGALVVEGLLAQANATKSAGASALFDYAVAATADGGSSAEHTVAIRATAQNGTVDNYAYFGVAGQFFNQDAGVFNSTLQVVGASAFNSTASFAPTADVNNENLTNNHTGRTASINGISLIFSGSVNTTGGAVSTTGFTCSVSSTKSAGAASANNACISVDATGGDNNTAIFTTNGNVELNQGASGSTDVGGDFAVRNSGTRVFRVFHTTGAVNSLGTQPTVTGCTGTGFVQTGGAWKGRVIAATATTSCTLTFANTLVTCIVTNETLGALAYNVSGTVLTVTNAGLGGTPTNYDCSI